MEEKENVKFEKEIRAEAKGIRLTASELGLALALKDGSSVCGSMIENNLVLSLSPTHVRFSKIVSLKWPQFTAKISYKLLTSRGNNKR